MDLGKQFSSQTLSEVRVRSRNKDGDRSRNRHSTGSVQLYSSLWADPPSLPCTALYPSISPPAYTDPDKRSTDGSAQSNTITSPIILSRSPSLPESRGQEATKPEAERLREEEEEEEHPCDEDNERTPLIESSTLVIKPRTSMKKSRSGGIHNIRIGGSGGPVSPGTPGGPGGLGGLGGSGGLDHRKGDSVLMPENNNNHSEKVNPSAELGGRAEESFQQQIQQRYSLLVTDDGNGQRKVLAVDTRDYQPGGKSRDLLQQGSTADSNRKSLGRSRSFKRKNSFVIGADESNDGMGLCGWFLTALSWVLVIITMPFSLCVCFKVVQEYERAVIFRLGRLLSGGSKGPGIFFVLPCIESYQKVDLRTITLGVPPQEVLTKDSVTVSVDAVVYYRVSNATVSVANVENAHHSTRLLAQTTLRNILGTKNLHEILSDRESISGSMQAALDDATEPWGIKVERVEIKDVRLPVQLQRAMAAEAEAAREARAKVIAAEGEQKASRALKEASEVMSQSSAALQLRYLQTLNSISAEHNSTVIFPLPIDLLRNLMKK